MGAVPSVPVPSTPSLTENDVKDIIDDNVDLNNYLRTADANTNYLNKVSDKVSLSTNNNDDTKWVTPQYVTTKIGSGNINTSTVSTFLAASPVFSKTFRDTVINDNTFQGSLANNLAASNDFINGIYAKFNTTETENVFRNNLKDSLITSLKADTGFIESARGPRGQDGTFNNASIKTNLWNGTGNGEGKKVLWCADGDLCQVPIGKTGIQFTEAAQKIVGYGATTTSPKVVYIQDHLGVSKTGSINFASDRTTTGQGSLGTDDAIIKTVIKNDVNNPTDGDINDSYLSINGIGRMKGDGSRVNKKIQLNDDVTVNGNLKVNGTIELGGKQLHLGDGWFIQVGGNLLDIKRKISDTKTETLVRMYDTSNDNRLIVFKRGDGQPPFGFYQTPKGTADTTSAGYWGVNVDNLSKGF
jgi:hypothetical protein